MKREAYTRCWRKTVLYVKGAKGKKAIKEKESFNCISIVNQNTFHVSTET